MRCTVPQRLVAPSLVMKQVRSACVLGLAIASVLTLASALPATTYCSTSVHATTTFRNKVDTICVGLGIPGAYLMAVMDFESGINPAAVNSYSGATGLIQFLPSTARSLGTTTTALKAMDAITQLDWVKKYLTPLVKSGGTLSDTYMAVFYPVAVGKAESYVLFDSSSSAYPGNKALDLNKDGKITKAEAASRVTSRYNANAGKCSGGTSPTAAATSSLNIRSGPGTSYSVVGTVAQGTVLRLVCYTSGTTVNGDSQWIKVSSPAGYASDYYLDCGGQLCGTKWGLPRC